MALKGATPSKKGIPLPRMILNSHSEVNRYKIQRLALEEGEQDDEKKSGIIRAQKGTMMLATLGSK